MSDATDDLGIAVDLLRAMRAALGPDLFRRAVEEAETPEEPLPERQRKRRRETAASGAQKATALAPPDEIAKARARRAAREGRKHGS